MSRPRLRRVTIELPIEFIELCVRDQVEPQTVLRGFIADLCGLIIGRARRAPTATTAMEAMSTIAPRPITSVSATAGGIGRPEHQDSAAALLHPLAARRDSGDRCHDLCRGEKRAG